MKKLLILFLCFLPSLFLKAGEVTDAWSGLTLQIPDAYKVDAVKEQTNGQRFFIKGPEGSMHVLYFNASAKNEMESAGLRYFKRNKIKTLDKAFFNLENPVYARKDGFLDWGRTEWEFHYLDKTGDEIPTVCTLYYWHGETLYCFLIQDRNGNFQPYKEIIDSADNVKEPVLSRFLNLFTNEIVGYVLMILFMLCGFMIWAFFGDGVDPKELKEGWSVILLFLAGMGIIAFLLRSDKGLLFLLSGGFLAVAVVAFIHGLVKKRKGK